MHPDHAALDTEDHLARRVVAGTAALFILTAATLTGFPGLTPPAGAAASMPRTANPAGGVVGEWVRDRLSDLFGW